MFDRKDIAMRQLTRAEIPEGMRIKNAAGWNQLESVWLLCLLRSAIEELAHA